jgi:pimeloyl-ACP methyl ester carboxylesterase
MEIHMTIIRRLRSLIQDLIVFYEVWRIGELKLTDLPAYLGLGQRGPIDPDLTDFAAHGLALPPGGIEHRVEHDGASIWCMAYGEAFRHTAILLHGGLGHSGNFANQIRPLTAAAYRVIVIDSRGHGRSSRDARPYTYELMAGDVLAVMDTLDVRQAGLVGWSDGAAVALTLAKTHRERVAGVFFFACNMDPSGAKEIDQSNPLINRCFGRHAKDYAAMATERRRSGIGSDGGDFKSLVNVVTEMQRTQPNWSAADLASVTRQVAIVTGENDEFIRREHLQYLARTIPAATYRELPGVSHFAPIQDPSLFNAFMCELIWKLPLVYSREYMGERGLLGKNV